VPLFTLVVLVSVLVLLFGSWSCSCKKDDGGGGDNWTTAAISHAKLQSYHHHQQTNIQSFFSGRMPFLLPNQQRQSIEGKNITFHGHAYPKLTWGLPTLSLTINSSWLPWGRVAMPLISPLMPVPPFQGLSSLKNETNASRLPRTFMNPWKPQQLQTANTVI